MSSVVPANYSAPKDTPLPLPASEDVATIAAAPTDSGEVKLAVQGLIEKYSGEREVVVTAGLRIKRFLIVFFAMGLWYLDIEVIFRAMIQALVGIVPKSAPPTSPPFTAASLVGFTSLWMFFVGGLSGVLLGFMNEIEALDRRLNIFWQCVIGTIGVLILELVTGVIFNVWLKLNIWDYSELPGSILGQVTPLFAVFWMLLCPFGFWADDALRHVLFRDGGMSGLFAWYKGLVMFWASPQRLKFHALARTKQRQNVKRELAALVATVTATPSVTRDDTV